MSDLEAQIEAARRRIAGRTITESNDMNAAIRQAAGMAPPAPLGPEPVAPQGVDQEVFDAAVAAEVARQRPPGIPRVQLQSGSVTPFDHGARTPDQILRQLIKEANQ